MKHLRILLFLFADLYLLIRRPTVSGENIMETRLTTSVNTSKIDTAIQKKPGYDIVFGHETFKKIIAYKKSLLARTTEAGAYLKNSLNAKKTPLEQISDEEFITLLLSTKEPVIFAESEIEGDNTDWNRVELQILGDINIAVPVDIYDNGVWEPSDKNFRTHDPPLKGELLFTPGALLRSDTMEGVPPDYEEVVTRRVIDQDKYNQLVDRRLTPLLYHANKKAADAKSLAIVTVPGIGCGAFAGDFRGKVGEHLNRALQYILRNNSRNLTSISCVYYDPFSECKNEKFDINGIKYRVRPQRYNDGKSQLSNPKTFEEFPDDHFSTSKLFKIVAWDHVSYPGNDYFLNSRNTDDGVSAAATNSMEIITGVRGKYEKGYYLPPEGKTDWRQVVRQGNITLRAEGNVKILTSDKKYLSLLKFERGNSNEEL